LRKSRLVLIGESDERVGNSYQLFAQESTSYTVEVIRTQREMDARVRELMMDCTLPLAIFLDGEMPSRAGERALDTLVLLRTIRHEHSYGGIIIGTAGNPQIRNMQKDSGCTYVMDGKSGDDLFGLLDQIVDARGP